MDLNDHLIKDAIRLFLSSSEDRAEEAVILFRKEVELYVYHFPRLAYRKGLDVCSDFYLYLMDRLESILKNYPIQEDLKFKTWFNYVLRNQFIHFCKYRSKGKVREYCIDDFENEFRMDVFDHPDLTVDEIQEGLSGMEEIDRFIIKLYYLPDLMDAGDMRKASAYFKIPMGQMLIIHRELIQLHEEGIENTRKLSEKLNLANSRLSEMKYQLHQKARAGRQVDLEESGGLLLQIARFEAKKNRALREMKLMNKPLFTKYSALFGNAIKAKNRLLIAKKKLKALILNRISCNKGVYP